MAELISITCDVCGIAKQAANHWWRGRLVPRTGGVMIFPAATAGTMKRKPGDVDLCGQAHAHAWIDGYLQQPSKAERRPDVEVQTAAVD
jgi:hypothetical protein